MKSPLSHLRILLTLWLAVPLCASHVAAQLTAVMSSSFLAPGEEAPLLVSAVGHLRGTPEIPDVPGLRISSYSRPQLEPYTNRQYRTTYEFIVSALRPGRYTIPGITAIVNGQQETSAPLEITIIEPSAIAWSDADFGGTSLKCGAALFTRNASPWVGEAMEVELKIFVPKSISIDDWGIPDIGKDGITAWRFEPTRRTSTATLMGRGYQSVSYPTTMVPTREGKSTLGPGRVRPSAVLVVYQGVPRRIAVQGFIDIPALDITARPLPPDAPDGFENTVGQFTATASTTVSEGKVGDPIPVDLIVTGSGNLDSITVPKLQDDQGNWVTYDSTADDRGKDRTQLTGQVVFHQFVRPTAVTDRIPAFKLDFFNPATGRYESATTRPMPITIRPAPLTTNAGGTPSAIVPAGKVPVERMTDILGLIPRPAASAPWQFQTPPWLVHVLGGGVFALILLVSMLRKARASRARSSEQLGRAQELRAIESIPAQDTRAFLMAAGRYVEHWFGQSTEPELRSILEQRDETCFRPTEETPATPNASARQKILKALRKYSAALCLGVVACIIWPSVARAEDEASMAKAAYDAADYPAAISHWLASAPPAELSADTLYNIGNACYRMNQPGHAALYYRRALLADPAHPEAMQNLRFLERKLGSVSILRADYQNLIARLPLAMWHDLTWAAIWGIAICLLILLTARSRSRARHVAAVALAILPFLAAFAALAWRHFPEDCTFAPVARRAVIITATALHTDASRTSPEVMDAPQGSLCEIIRTSGDWAYVGFSNQTRGWVLRNTIEPLELTAKPEVPKPGAERDDNPSST